MKAINQTPRRIISKGTILMAMTLSLISLVPGNGITQPMREGPDPSSGDELTLLRTDDGIALYQHWIKLEGFPEGREMVVEFTVKADLATALGLVMDETMAATWMTSIKELRILDRVGENSWYSYILYDIPWPLRKQDVVILNRLEKDPQGNRVSIEMDAAPRHLPENKGVTRISHMIGTWQFCTESQDRTHVRYSVYSGQRSSFPRWITDPIIQGNLVRTMKNFREVAENTNDRKQLCTQSGS